MSESPQYKVIWAETAKRDLIEIVEYIAIDSLPSAKKTANKIQRKCQTLETHPAEAVGCRNYRR